MITNHFKALVAGLLIGNGNNNSYGTYHYLNIQGQDRYFAGYTYTPTPFTPATSATDTGIHLGSGTTPPTADDYALEDDVTKSLSVTVTSSTREETESGWNRAVRMTLTNTSDAPVTVAEIGFYGQIRGATSKGATSTTATNVVTMFDRTLLDEPITIPASYAATLEYTLETSL